MYFQGLILFVLVAATASARADDTVDNAKIAQLINQMGDRSYQQRESAENELFKIGESALPQLHVAVRTHTDVEVKARAKNVIDRIMIALCQSRSTGMKLAYARAGEFQMGSDVNEKDRRDDENQHKVRISRPFLIGAHEVTQAEFAAVMDYQPSWFSPKGNGAEKIAKINSGELPVDSVTWFDAIEFCNRLSERDGFQPYYSITDVKTENESRVSAKVEIVGGTGYRLPTEAEWEYACRAGSSTPYHFGEADGGGNYIHRVSTRNYGTGLKKLGRSTTVGSYKPNAWGIHDMHGNVAEWCWDWYGKSYYGNSPADDPNGPLNGDHRVLRGGSWLVKQTSCRSATRFWNVPGKADMHIGFRIARTPTYTADDRKPND